MDADGVLTPDPLPASGGVWIAGNQIRFIEFIDLRSEEASDDP